MLEGAGITKDPERWVAGVERDTMAALQELGEATATDLTKRVPGLREQIEFGEGKTWAGKVGVSPIGDVASIERPKPSSGSAVSAVAGK